MNEDKNLCPKCVKYSYCDMVEDMEWDGEAYKEECDWFKPYEKKEEPILKIVEGL